MGKKKSDELVAPRSMIQ